MKKLKITDAQDFRTHIEKTIKEDNLFFHEYQIAVDNLNCIWKSQSDLEKTKESFDSEYPNNIIAFCGERGSGKSSVMLSFMNAIVNSGKEDKFDFSKEIRTNDWSANIIIDPSMFDGVHNIVDIVLAHIYHSFDELYSNDNQRIDKYNREEMLKSLAKTYKSLSIIKNKEKMLDDEYDVVGNIAKLQKLGESTQLKKSLEKLVDLYLKLISTPENNREKNSKKLLIAIDDLDLCNEHAYEMAEQIRKYLVLPNVVILMAIKIEQMEMGIEEKNRENFKSILMGRREDSADREMRSMAERYVTKLIPKARRIYLPELESTNVLLELSEDSKSDNAETDTDTIENTVIRLIRKKTGMIFVPSENAYNSFVPRNLRELVNLITLLEKMKQPDCCTQTKLENLYEFHYYFIEEMMKKHIDGERLSDLTEILEGGDYAKNYNMANYLDDLLSARKKKRHAYENLIYDFPNTSLAFVMEKLIIAADYLTKEKDYKLLYYIRAYYTILLNERLQEAQQESKKFSTRLIDGFIWGKALSNVIPVTERGLYRERFFINTLTCWNAIADAVCEWNKSLSVQRKKVSQNHVSGIKGENKLAEILCWLLLALLACPKKTTTNGKYIMYKGSFVYNNYQVSSMKITVSVENYFVNICSLQDLYGIANLELLGVTETEISHIISSMEKNNAPLIEMAKAVSVNVDLSMNLLAYCDKNKDYKAASMGDRTYKLLERFFENVSDYLKEDEKSKKDIEDKGRNVEWSKLWIPTEINEQGEVAAGDYINICQVYAKIFKEAEKSQGEQNSTNSTENYYNKSVAEGMILKNSFAHQVGTVSSDDYSARIYVIPTYLKNKTSRYVKDILENIANGIQKYTYREKKYPDDFDVQRLINLYSEVVDLYMENPGKDISERQHNEYKEIAKIADKIVTWD